MRALLGALCLAVVCATRAGAEPVKDLGALPAVEPVAPAVASPADLSLSALPSALPAALPVAPALAAQAQATAFAPQAQASRPADLGQRIRQISLSAAEAGKQTQAPAPDGGRDAASRQFSFLTGAEAGDEAPTAQDIAAAKMAGILRNPAVPPRVALVIERELGLTVDSPLFHDIGRRGGQPRNAHTNEPIGAAYDPVNPAGVIVGLFNLREQDRPYYDSLRNAKTGVVATGVRGGVDAMLDDLLSKGELPPRSAGRNHRFRTGVYMDLPDRIHRVNQWAKVDPARAEGKDRYPMAVSFRASNVHHPGSEYEGRIVGDGGTLGQVALDPVTDADIVSVYVPKARMAQTISRLKGTPLEDVQVYPLDVLPEH